MWQLQVSLVPGLKRLYQKDMFSEPVYKIFRPFEWDGFQVGGTFAGSADDMRDGFIHLCTRTQMEGVLQRFFTSEEEVIIATALFDEAAALNLKRTR